MKEKRKGLVLKTGAVGIEINPAPRSLRPNLWVQMRFWPWERFGRTLCSGYWIAVMAPLWCILLSSSGCCVSVIRVFKTTKNSNKYPSKTPPKPIEIMDCMRRGHALIKKKMSWLFRQSRAASFGTAQQFSINSKLLQTSVFDPFLHPLCVLAVNAS